MRGRRKERPDECDEDERPGASRTAPLDFTGMSLSDYMGEGQRSRQIRIRIQQQDQLSQIKETSELDYPLEEDLPAQSTERKSGKPKPQKKFRITRSKKKLNKPTPYSSYKSLATTTASSFAQAQATSLKKSGSKAKTFQRFFKKAGVRQASRGEAQELSKKKKQKFQAYLQNMRSTLQMRMKETYQFESRHKV